VPLELGLVTGADEGGAAEGEGEGEGEGEEESEGAEGFADGGAPDEGALPTPHDAARALARCAALLRESGALSLASAADADGGGLGATWSPHALALAHSPLPRAGPALAQEPCARGQCPCLPTGEGEGVGEGGDTKEGADEDEGEGTDGDCDDNDDASGGSGGGRDCVCGGVSSLPAPTSAGGAERRAFAAFGSDLDGVGGEEDGGGDDGGGGGGPGLPSSLRAVFSPGSGAGACGFDCDLALIAALAQPPPRIAANGPVSGALGREGDSLALAGAWELACGAAAEAAGGALAHAHALAHVSRRTSRAMRSREGSPARLRRTRRAFRDLARELRSPQRFPCLGPHLRGGVASPSARAAHASVALVAALA
jgi:hypothetical protein